MKMILTLLAISLAFLPSSPPLSAETAKSVVQNEQFVRADNPYRVPEKDLRWTQMKIGNPVLITPIKESAPIFLIGTVILVPSLILLSVMGKLAKKRKV